MIFTAIRQQRLALKSCAYGNLLSRNPSRGPGQVFTNENLEFMWCLEAEQCRGDQGHPRKTTLRCKLAETCQAPPPPASLSLLLARSKLDATRQAAGPCPSPMQSSTATCSPSLRLPQLPRLFALARGKGLPAARKSTCNPAQSAVSSSRIRSRLRHTRRTHTGCVQGGASAPPLRRVNQQHPSPFAVPPECRTSLALVARFLPPALVLFGLTPALTLIASAPSLVPSSLTPLARRPSSFQYSNRTSALSQEHHKERLSVVCTPNTHGPPVFKRRRCTQQPARRRRGVARDCHLGLFDQCAREAMGGGGGGCRAGLVGCKAEGGREARRGAAGGAE